MIPKILHFTVPAVVSADQKKAIETARALHPDWEVRVWQDPVDPAGFDLAPYWRKANSGAQLADLIRIEVVHRFGGVYLDADVELLRSLDSLRDHSFVICSEDGVRATNAVFGAERDHPVLKSMIAALQTEEPNWRLQPTITTGPEFFARFVKWRSDVTVLPREAFYAYNWHQRQAPPPPAAFGEHKWAGSWRSRSRIVAATRSLGPFSFSRVAKVALRKLRSWAGKNQYIVKAFSPKVHGYSGSGVVVRRTVHGHVLFLDAADASITPELMTRGYYELQEELLLRRILRGGDYFVDVGANFGAFSILAASLVGPFGRVFSYEPNPKVAELLKQAALANWIHDRIIVRGVAVGDRAGAARLEFNDSCLGGAAIDAIEESDSAARTRALSGPLRYVDVDVVTLDQEFRYDVPIKFLKIDAEGLEPAVLAGASRLLEACCIEYLMLEMVQEISGRQWNSVVACVRGIVDRGYTPYVVGRHGRLVRTTLAKLTDASLTRTRNVVLKRDPAMARRKV